jgi:hypothetical protein
MVIDLLLQLDPSGSRTLPLDDPVHQEAGRVDVRVAALVPVLLEGLAAAFEVAEETFFAGSLNAIFDDLRLR